MSDAELELAKRVEQIGHLEAQLWDLRGEVSRLRRHRGTLTGLVRGALNDNAVRGDYAELARGALAAIDAER